MISFSDRQMQLIMAAARHLPPDDRSEFLKLVADQLKPKTIDVADAARRALAFFAERGLFECTDDR
jgi:hypothetical protein